MASTTSFLDAVANRRSIYALNKSPSISDARIQEIITQLVKDVPSSFNSQSSRLVLLLKDEHDKFWDIVRDILKAIVPEAQWEHTGNRIAGFRGGYGTVSAAVSASLIPNQGNPADHLLSRSSSTKTPSQSKPSKPNLPSTLTGSRPGLSTHPPCTSTPHGRRWKLRV
jgi:hypothetical protein